MVGIFDIRNVSTQLLEINLKHHYRRLLEKQLTRLWINQYSICVNELGKDKFYITDGKRGFQAKGHEIYKAIQKVPDKGGYAKFWIGMRELEKIYQKKVRARAERKRKVILTR